MEELEGLNFNIKIDGGADSIPEIQDFNKIPKSMSSEGSTYVPPGTDIV